MSLFKRPAPANYSEQTHASPYWIVRWPHEKRFQFASEQIAAGRPRTLLDYGAGDGYLLERMAAAGTLPPNTVAYEPLDYFAGLLQETIDRAGLADRVTIARTTDELLGHSFDCISCLGVLEHLPLPQRKVFYDISLQTLAPGGRVVIDIPVETGPAVVVKEIARRVLKKRDPEYSVRELIGRGLGRGGPDKQRVDPTNPAMFIVSHMGFDHRAQQAELREVLQLERSLGSPLPWLPPRLGNQEIILTFRRQP